MTAPEDLIRQILREELAAFFSGMTPAVPQSLSLAQQAINLARQGKHAESKELLKAHARRKAA